MRIVNVYDDRGAIGDRLGRLLADADLKAFPLPENAFEFFVVVKEHRDILAETCQAMGRHRWLGQAKLTVELPKRVHAQAALLVLHAFPRREPRHVLFCKLLNAIVGPDAKGVEREAGGEHWDAVVPKMSEHAVAVHTCGEGVTLVREGEAVARSEHLCFHQIVKRYHVLGRVSCIYKLTCGK